MIIMNLYYKLNAGEKQNFLDEVYSLEIVEKTKAENGCIAYDFFAAYDKDCVLLVEKWENDESLDAHKNQEHLKKLLSLKDKYGITTAVEVYNKSI